MNQKYLDLLPFELAFYDIYLDGYDPLKTIRDFWTHYSIYECHEHIKDVYESFVMKCDYIDVTDQNKKYEFFIVLLRLMIAYFMVHYRKIKIDDLKFLFADSSDTIDTDFMIRKRIHEFFDRVNKQF